MLGLGIVFVWAGYAVSGYGWVLLRGWDIPLRAWMSPLHPYQWPPPGQNPPTIPPGQLFPSSGTTGPSNAGTSAGTVSSSAQQQRLNRAARQENRPAPGSVASRF